VRDVLPPEVPLTIKMRRGMDDRAKSRDDFFAILDGAFELGVAAVCVHGRTVRQRYEGRSSWEFVREVKQHVGNRTVLGSGDLFTAEDCLAMIHQTGVDGVTAARGAIGNPWIFRQARQLAVGQQPHVPDLKEQREVIAEHFRLCEQLYGPVRCCRHMRKFGIKYSQLHPRGEEVRQAFVIVSDCRQLPEILDKWYGSKG
jgi:tRNA-dihydrouridine synthase B